MPMTVGTAIGADLSAVPQRARELEALGYDSIWVGEMQSDPFLPLTLVAEHTERMQLGTSVAIAFPRAPYITANLSWDLARFSGGRFVLGLGTQVKGHNERRFSVPWVPPGPRLRDYIRCMRAVWDSWQNGTKPDYEGEYYQYRLTNPMFNAGPIEHPDIKVMIAALNPFNSRLAGEVCDGIDIHPFCSFRYVREVVLPAVYEGAGRAGKDPKDLIIRGGGLLVTGRNAQELERAREDTRRQLSFYGSTRSYSNVMKLHGWAEEAAQLHTLSIEGEWDRMVNVVTDEMMDELCAIGTWDQIAGELRDKYAAARTEIGFNAVPRDPDEAAQIKEIIAELKTIPAVGEA